MPVKDYKSSISVHNATIDPDIRLEDIDCPIQQELLKRFNSVVYYDSMMDDTIIHYYTKEICFSFDMMPVCIYPNFDRVKDDEYHGTDNMVAICPILRAIYVLESERNKGLQHQLLTDLITLSEEHLTPFVAFASPFVINLTSDRGNRLATNGVYVNYPYQNGLHACHALEVHGYQDDLRTDGLVEKQCKRFKRAGLSNIEVADAVLTKPHQHWIYVPAGLNEDLKRTLESNQVR